MIKYLNAPNQQWLEASQDCNARLWNPIIPRFNAMQDKPTKQAGENFS